MSKKKILILGITGMLGHVLYEHVLNDLRFEAAGTVRSESSRGKLPEKLNQNIHYCDVLSLAQVIRVIDEVAPDILVNCVGVVKQLKVDTVEIVKINALLPHELEKISTERGIRLVQISTDCVFSGKRGDYSEADIPDPVDLYGKSKLLGEVSEGAHITLRTSFIGYELGTRHSLLEWFLSQSGQINGFKNAIWSGLTAPALARLIIEIALRNDMIGIYNVAGEEINKYDLLLRFKEFFTKNDIEIAPMQEPWINRSLQSEAIKKKGIIVPGMDEMIAELATEYSQRARK